MIEEIFASTVKCNIGYAFYENPGQRLPDVQNI